MKSTRYKGLALTVALVVAATAGLAAPANEAYAAGYPQSLKIAMIPDAGGRYNSGGTLPLSGFPGAYAPEFTDVSTESVRDEASDPLASGGFDTVVLNSICDIDLFLADPQFKSRIESFVHAGGKLIIWDSECTSTDYSKFAIPFHTSNPGAAGAQGTLVDVEENTLSSADSSSAQYVDVAAVASGTDAVGDANVFTTYDPRWFVDLRATNVLGVDGPVHAYANLGSGLIIYSGLDKDFLPGGGFDPTTTDGATHLNRIWLLELLQPWDPDGLPNSTPASGSKDLRYVALGDSYSSGEGAGAGNYYQYKQRQLFRCTRTLVLPTGVPLVKDGLSSPLPAPWTCTEYTTGVDIPCHRAPTAWSFVLAEKSGDIRDAVENAACSGSTVETNLLDNWSEDGFEQPQVRRLAELNAIDPVDLVTFTIGGNDIGFSEIVKACFLSAVPGFTLTTIHGSYTPSCAGYEKKVDTALPELARDFDRVIQELHAAAPDAALAFVSYPQVVPDDYNDVTTCSWLSKAENSSMRSVVGKLNLAQYQAVQRGRAKNIDVEFIDITDALKGHEICTASSHVVKIYGNPWNSEQGHPDSVDRDGDPSNGVQGSGQEDLAMAVYTGLRAKALISR